MSRKYAVVLVNGGIQSGKTYVGSRFAAIRTLQNKSSMPFWIASPTLKMARAPEVSFLTSGMEKLLCAKNLEERVYTFVTPNGQKRVEVKSAENADWLRGPSVLDIWFDEASTASKESFLILMGRLLASGGTMLITTTPKGKGSWLYEEIWKRWEEGDPNYFCITLPTNENPSLDKRMLNFLDSRYEGKWKSQELFGEFVDLSGGFFMFDPSRHVLCGDVKLEETDELYTGHDFGFVDATVCLWVVRRGNSLIVYDEHYLAGSAMDAHIQEIRRRPFDKRVLIRFADPSAAQQMLDWSLRGVHMVKAVRDRLAGWMRIHNLLASGKLQIHESCIKLIQEMSTAEGDGQGDLKKGQVDHALDALRYVVASLHQYEESVDPKHKYDHLDHSSRNVWLSVDEMTKERKEDDVWENLSLDPY